MGYSLVDGSAACPSAAAVLALCEAIVKSTDVFILSCKLTMAMSARRLVSTSGA